MDFVIHNPYLANIYLTTFLKISEKSAINLKIKIFCKSELQIREKYGKITKLHFVQLLHKVKNAVISRAEGHFCSIKNFTSFRNIIFAHAYT